MWDEFFTHFPRSLKCSSVNGGSAKPAPEHTYAVVNREFLCDCHFDLEHASVLRQLSSCSKSSSSKMQMKFTIHLAFWEMCKNRSPNSASNIQPQYTEEVQTFSVDLYEPQIKKLDQPVHSENYMETMGTDGLRIPTPEEREASQPMQTIMPRWLNNVLVMTCTAMTTVLMIVISILLAKHFNMKALVSMLAISSLPPPREVANFTAAAIASALVVLNPAIGTKVVCAYPVIVIWKNILGYLVLAYAITQYFRPVTWSKGYKYNKKCALYIFVYDSDHERYSPLKIMSLKGQMLNYRMKYTGDGLSLTLVKWTYDKMTISWEGVQVIDKSGPINLPVTVTVALRHIIMTRRIAQQLGEVHYMLKQGSSWHDITDYYRARKKAVKLKAETGDKGASQSPKKEKSQKKKKVQVEPVEV